MSRRYTTKKKRVPLRRKVITIGERKNNLLDKIKKEKFSPLSKEELEKQKRYFQKFIKEVLRRKELGNKKYGNYIFECDVMTAKKEIKEELMDVCNHCIVLAYRIDNDRRIK